MPQTTPEEQIATIYSTLALAWGRQHWWPAQSRFEVIVGAYLTQNTSWGNVEIAMKCLRSARVLNVAGIRKLSLPKLERLIRSSGYFRQKARRLKTFINFLDRKYSGSLEEMFLQPTSKLREQLLSLNGVGPETADSILLYAGQHPTFVVDAYTRRLLGRHGILPENATYEVVRNLCEGALGRVAAPDSLPPLKIGKQQLLVSHHPSPMSLAKRAPVTQAYNDMHGLIV